MTDTELWSAAAGFIGSMFVLPLIQQPRWSERVRALVTLVWCVVVAAVTAYLTGAFDGVRDGREWASASLAVFIAAIVSYKGFGKPTGLTGALERATSPPPGDEPYRGRHHRPD